MIWFVQLESLVPSGVAKMCVDAEIDLGHTSTRKSMCRNVDAALTPNLDRPKKPTLRETPSEKDLLRVYPGSVRPAGSRSNVAGTTEEQQDGVE